MRARSACARLDAEVLARLRAAGRECDVPAGHSLFREHDPADCLYTLHRGLVRLSACDAEGREQVLAFHAPGDVIGLTARARHDHRAEAVTASRLCRWPRARAGALAASHAGLGDALLNEGLVALDRARDQARCLGQRSAVSRLAWFLVQLEAAGSAAPALRLPMSRSDIAANLGLSTEAVSRSFTRLRHAGIVALPRADLVRVLRPGALRLAAGLVD